MDILIYGGLGLLGLILGSFGGATVWRLRARQLQDDKEEGEKVDKKEYDSLVKLLKPTTEDRSECLHCHHQLAWYDLLPLVSWVALGGKCRYCGKPIGVMEPLIEMGTGLFFTISYLAWPVPLDSALAILQFALWLIVGVGLIILFAYDSRWFLLPNRIMFPIIGLSIISIGLKIAHTPDPGALIVNACISILILSGLYYALYLISRGRWIGFGDIKLGVVLALMLADWRLAFLTLFLANLIGCIIVLPGLMAKKLGRHSHVPFGPMLIGAFFITGLFGQWIINWYFGGLTLY